MMANPIQDLLLARGEGGEGGCHGTTRKFRMDIRYRDYRRYQAPRQTPKMLAP
jgi:hypothetical protein